MDWIPEAALVAATVVNGLLAGVFLAFSCGVVPGLRRVDDLSYVTVFRAVNASIVNPLFMLVFLGAPIATGAALVLHLDAARQDTPAYLVAGLVLGLLSFAVTAFVNVPLNTRLVAAPIGDAHQRMEARDRFEMRWNRWNHVRTITSTAAVVLLAIS
ncbi:anthrone oxygenase family protein [Agromyces sp. PvR057]|uniref:anthrone oxygenase family protein n=1 Tax=Agromyces sp. PvR057 TaxID=3156403 RepID=UPI000E21D8B3